MKRKSSHLIWLKRALWKRAMDTKDPEERKDWRYLHKAAKDAEEEIDEIIRDSEMQGLRNPAFPDDLVGWLDDDFSLPEDYWSGKNPPEDDGDEN